MSGQVWLCGTLAGHRRGKVLEEAGGARPTEARPEGGGVCLLFATDFQEGENDFRREWLEWTQRPGRVLLLVPPFAQGICTQPVEWEAIARRDVKPSAERTLPRTLAAEVRHELRGSLQIAREIGGMWEDYAINTAYFRRHPHSGLFAITCLPIWSLIVLDHPDRLRDWLDGLLSLAGEAEVLEEAPAPDFAPRPEHYTVLLHLLSGRFTNRDEVLAALSASPILRLDAEIAGRCYDELAEQGLIADGGLTERGREVVAASEYAVYAEELAALGRSTTDWQAL